MMLLLSALSRQQRLREFGYVEDRTVALFVRAAVGRPERYPESTPTAAV